MSEGEVIQSKIDPCKICCKKVTVNSVLCTKCDQWIHEKCSKLKKETPSAARFSVCSKCDKATNGVVEMQQEVLSDKVEIVKGFCCHGDRMNGRGGCEAIVIARTRVGWKKFKECEKILYGKRFFLKKRYIKGI